MSARKQLRLQRWQACRGRRVWVEDVLAVETAAAAKAEMLRRAQALGSSFGKQPDDRIIFLADLGPVERFV